MSAVWHSRHVCCVTQRTCLLCDTVNESAVTHRRHDCYVTSRHVCCAAQQTCPLSPTADICAVSEEHRSCFRCLRHSHSSCGLCAFCIDAHCLWHCYSTSLEGGPTCFPSASLGGYKSARSFIFAFRPTDEELPCIHPIHWILVVCHFSCGEAKHQPCPLSYDQSHL